MSGILYIVATPIGNLADITLRALDVLKEVNVIAAEDTRHTMKLLNHYQISTKTMALHDHNEKQIAAKVVERLQQGQTIALVSDAGTPLISDPGYALVNACREAGVTVMPIPGPSATIAALCCAGLPTNEFSFRGFTPPKSHARQAFYQKLAGLSETMVCYESPRRLLASIEDLIVIMGEQQQIVMAKELTKTYETFFYGTAIQLKEWLVEDENRQKGEIVLIIKGKEKAATAIPEEAMTLMTLLQEELPLKKAAAITAKHFDLKKNDLYKAGLAEQA
ncbi:16S rRNA (cytidine(1402)-2'-O)-methyltransferase [Flocculibacter collagenilyticus]|uniref:16S rRNA (cytidine(1402)-2'-O)-methyltransferase n=1 Tax=Flocculibacter collagenilyticus TaxID=2744479 RepID=UPI0018F416D3|nr:16S rRNA (cytidine(1402)-2'-O)-methyltransferase [Flocculibacter collagenilyticus]